MSDRMDCSTLKQKYTDACRRQGILPNRTVLSSLLMVEVKDFGHEPRIFEIFLDHLKDSDFLPVYELFSEIDNSVIDGVDIYNETPCIMNGSYVLSLMHAISKKLHAVHLTDLSLERAFLRDLSQRGLTCRVLNFRYSQLRKLNLTGNFMLLESLNLDFNTSLTSFEGSCFSCMPNLKYLSMCATRVSNLWITRAALGKLPSLIQLRFQNCLCCNNTGPCPVSASQRMELTDSVSCDDNSHIARGKCGDNSHVLSSPPHSHLLSQPLLGPEEAFEYPFVLEDESVGDIVERPTEDLPEDYEGDFQEFANTDLLSSAIFNWDLLNNNAAPLGLFSPENGDVSGSGFYDRDASTVTGFERNKYLSHHPSPICFEKHYRDYMIASLPQLEVLDNLTISNRDKENAKHKFSKYFECLPYKRQCKESIVSILRKREVNTSRTHVHKRESFGLQTNSAHYHTRSLGAAKVGSSLWPSVHPLTTSGYVYGDEKKSFRPRQFEYHPSDSGLMAFGTLDGEVVVVNHENEKIFSYVPSMGAMNSVLGLCWLKKYPSKLIAGSDNGSLRLFDIKHWRSAVTGRNFSANDFAFDDFDQLTSVHVNATDELFVASGYSKNVALYDINTGKCLNVFSNMHQQHINVVKFSNYSPSMFATSSFDQDVKMWDLRQRPIHPCFTATSSRGNVMVCFSPDDLYLLVSAVDNEVKQLSAVDGRILVDFQIASTGSSQNYTRSYYMNGRDYIISGSCDENVVRICCAQTGRRLRDISLEGRWSGASMFVQSLRGDPFRDFNMSILAAYMRPSSKSEIIKVNLMASSDYSADPFDDDTCFPAFYMGG